MGRSGGGEDRRIAPAAVSWPRLLGLFLRIGAVGFGGGMAVIALMERELVDQRRLMPAEEFLHGVGLSQVLGPFAVNTAFFVGYRRHGLLGGLSAAAAFLAPSVAAVMALSALYFRYHHVPALAGALAGLGPMVIALILAAAWSMGRKAVTSWAAAMLAAAGLVAGIFKANAVWVLLSAGAVGLLLGRRGGASPEEPAVPPEVPARGGPGSGERIARLLPALAPAGVHSAGLAALLIAFAKVGLVFFGGGFVLVALLRHELVNTLQWLTPREFLDGVAISTLTPGPIAVLATFAGFKVHGIGGALAATVVALALLVRWRWHPAFVLVLGVAAALIGWVP